MKKGMAILFLIVFGCVAGGIFLRHETPDFFSGGITDVELEISLNAGNASRAFTRSTIYYWVDGQSKKNQKMKLVFSDRQKCNFVAALKVPEGSEGKKIYYFFEYVSDGQIYVYPDTKTPFVCIVN